MVTDLTSLMTALQTAPAGSTILLAGGHYGDLSMVPGFHFNFSGNVTIKAADPNNPPVFDTIFMQGVSNVTLSGLTVKMPATDTSVSHDAAVRVDGSSNIVLDNMTLTGSPAINGIDASSPVGTANPTGTIQGLPFGDAVSINNVQNITVSNSDISYFEAGIRTSNVDGFNVLNNEIYDIRQTPIGGGNTSNVLIDGNHVHDMIPWNYGGKGDHGDYVHFWTRPNHQTTPNDNIVVTNNFFDQGDGHGIIGVYIDDNGNGIGSTNVTVSNNIILTSNLTGVRFENVHGATITNNTIISPNETAGGDPGIILTGGTSTTTVSDNVVGGISVAYNSSTGVNPTNNLIVQREFPEKAGYLGDLYGNWLADAPTLADLIALPGSQVDSGNYGAAMTQPEYLPSGLHGFVLDAPGQGLGMTTHQLDASTVIGPNGLVSTSGARVRWDFGDGTTGNGLVTTHNYDQPGRYDATATVTLSNGQKVVINKTIEVVSPVALYADFDQGAGDQSAVQNPVTMSGGATIVHDSGSKVIDLNGGLVSYQRSTDFFDNSEFTLLADFRKSSLGDTGKLITFPGSFVVTIGAGSLNVAVTTDAGKNTLRAGNLPIDDTKWHQLAVTFSGATGEAILYLDGNEIARVAGLDDAIQRGLSSHDFHIGSPFGGSFTGHVDNVAFLKGALTAGDVQNLSSGANTLGGLLSAHLVSPTFDTGSTGGSSTATSGSTSGSGSTGTTSTTGDTSGSTDTGSTTTSGSGSTGSETTSSGSETGDTGGSTGSTGGTTSGGTGTSSGTGTAPGGFTSTATVLTPTGDPVVFDAAGTVIVRKGAGKIGIDTDNDGTMDQSVALQGDFSGGEFASVLGADQTMVSFVPHLTGLADQVAVTSVPYGSDALDPYLSGAVSSDFTVSVMGSGTAGFANSLGAYTYDDQGNITDVWMLAIDVTLAPQDMQITGVGPNEHLGFFIVQNGATRFGEDLLGATDVDLAMARGSYRLSIDDDVLTRSKLFFSHDASFNRDGVEHVVVGADPDSDGFLMGFEDQMRWNDRHDNDFQDVVLLIETANINFA